MNDLATLQSAAQSLGLDWPSPAYLLGLMPFSVMGMWAWAAGPHPRRDARDPGPGRRAAGAAGAPLQCDEPADFKTFRIGLFGLDKLANIAQTVAHLDAALMQIV